MNKKLIGKRLFWLGALFIYMGMVLIFAPVSIAPLIIMASGMVLVVYGLVAYFVRVWRSKK